jgi:manganese/zinc/iron transport system permease protein
MVNPYSGESIFGFFVTLLKRCAQLISGHPLVMATDELQLITLILIALSCTLVGGFLVQARKTMVANALSHTILLGIVVAFLLERLFSSPSDFSEGLSTMQLLVAAFVSALLTTFFTEYLTKKMHVQEDASIGLVFTLFFASGVILLTLFARNVHLGSELVMGSVDSLHKGDLISAAKIFFLNLVLFILFFKQFRLTVFDPAFASLQGSKPTLFRYLLLFQTAIVAMSAFQAVGVVMVLAFFVAPSLIVRPFINSMGTLLWVALGVSVVVSLLAVALSRHILSCYQIGLSTGGLAVLVLFSLYIISLSYAKVDR